MSLHRKKPKMARAAWRILYALWWSGDQYPSPKIIRWHRAVSWRKG